MEPDKDFNQKLTVRVTLSSSSSFRNLSQIADVKKMQLELKASPEKRKEILANIISCIGQSWHIVLLYVIHFVYVISFFHLDQENCPLFRTSKMIKTLGSILVGDDDQSVKVCHVQRLRFDNSLLPSRLYVIMFLPCSELTPLFLPTGTSRTVSKFQILYHICSLCFKVEMRRHLHLEWTSSSALLHKILRLGWLLRRVL
jgi:hypothetical protein